MAETFLGEWKMISNENFEELMKELGVGLMTRKLASKVKPNLRFNRNGDEWMLTTISSLKTHGIRFKLGQEFPEETVDGRKVSSTITLEGNTLVHVQKDKSGKIICSIRRHVENGQLKVVSFLCFRIYIFKIGTQ